MTSAPDYLFPTAGRTMLSRGRLSFLLVALWWPLPVLLGIFFVSLLGGYYTKIDSTYSEWMYLLWWGIPGYLVFALWTTRSVIGRDEAQVLRMVWLAPLKLLPFYAAPWVVYDLCHAFNGQSESLYMLLGWVTILPYLLVVGYVCACLTVALYRTVFS
ncbi:hypothetical protein LOY28_29130 [Pseudomonas sp. B21-017]|uniref:hypothetical protein n=1 Tax=Pseudomonas TaxID=286 RepID=UPI0003612C9A|nr:MULTISPECIES: hypothetical protein [Pseudomonas]UVM38716.1 hypothetical protein LOY28_29130 [Pseudomonas sp. B21-017]